MQELHSPIFGCPQPYASNSEALSVGIEVLNRLFGQLRGDALAVLHGSRLCHSLSEILCVDSQLSSVGGDWSSVIFVDGGNLFDPYLISETARLHSLRPEETLKNIWVSRAFTAYQLTALVTEKLPEILEQKRPKLVVVSNIAALYCDSGIGLQEAKRTFNRVTRFLWNLSHENRLLVVATSLSSRSRRRRQLELYLLARADVVVKVEEGNPCVKVDLEKHPSGRMFSVELFLEEQESQIRLEKFLEA